MMVIKFTKLQPGSQLFSMVFDQTNSGFAKHNEYGMIRERVEIPARTKFRDSQDFSNNKS